MIEVHDMNKRRRKRTRSVMRLTNMTKLIILLCFLPSVVLTASWISGTSGSRSGINKSPFRSRSSPPMTLRPIMNNFHSYNRLHPSETITTSSARSLVVKPCVKKIHNFISLHASNAAAEENNSDNTGENSISSSEIKNSSNNKNDSNMKEKKKSNVLFRLGAVCIIIGIIFLIFGSMDIVTKFEETELTFFYSTIVSKISTLSGQVNYGLIKQLDKLNNAGMKGLIIYTISFMIWELTFGITTPIETAAGMAFGIKKGIIVNAIGKTSGAVIAFVLGRFVLYDLVHKKLKKNEMLQLVELSIKETPLRVALLFRFSPLPEFVKNFGLSVLPVRIIYFLSALLLHGFPFTCLWTCVGAETANVMRGATPSMTLKVLLSGVSWFGFLISPTLIGLWFKSLRDKKQKLDQEQKPSAR